MIDISQRNPLISVSFDDPLQLAFDILSRRNGTHRLCVVREDGRVAAILSRTDLIRYFLNCSELQLILEQTVCETGIGLVYPKVTVKDSDRVLDALSCMSKEKISAVPVLSDNCIIGNISMADVKVSFFLKDFDLQVLLESKFSTRLQL